RQRRLAGEAARLVDRNGSRGERLRGGVAHARGAPARALGAVEPGEPNGLERLIGEGQERRAVRPQIDAIGEPIAEQRALLDAAGLRDLGEVADADRIALAGARVRAAALRGVRSAEAAVSGTES